MTQNKLYKPIIFLGLMIFLINFGCETCDDCGPKDAYPYFKFTVLNRTSLDTLKVDVSRIKAEIKTIEDLLADKTNTNQSDSLNSLKDVKTDSLAYYNALVSSVNSRLISIATINGRDNVFTFDEDETDSLKIFGIPIDANDTSSSYSIEIEGAEFSNELTINYILVDTIINDKITKAAKNLKIIEHNFDSIRGPYGCSEAICFSNKQTIYVEI